MLSNDPSLLLADLIVQVPGLQSITADPRAQILQLPAAFNTYTVFLRSVLHGKFSMMKVPALMAPSMMLLNSSLKPLDLEAATLTNSKRNSRLMSLLQI
jgi:hypothetical protein